MRVCAFLYPGLSNANPYETCNQTEEDANHTKHEPDSSITRPVEVTPTHDC